MSISCFKYFLHCRGTRQNTCMHHQVQFYYAPKSTSLRTCTQASVRKRLCRTDGSDVAHYIHKPIDIHIIHIQVLAVWNMFGGMKYDQENLIFQYYCVYNVCYADGMAKIVLYSVSSWFPSFSAHTIYCVLLSMRI